MKQFPKYEKFDSWEEAFDTCRERNRPLVVRVDCDGRTEINKIFPSGRGEVVHVADRVLPHPLS